MIDLFKSLKGAYADNTIRAYQADFKMFREWCETREVDPYTASGHQLAQFVEFEAQTRTTATMRRRSELCQFRFEDTQVVPKERFAINLRFSKTDQCGEGKLPYPPISTIN